MNRWKINRMRINFWGKLLRLKSSRMSVPLRRTSGDDDRGLVFLGWMHRQIRVPRRTRQICHIRGEQSEPAACISRICSPKQEVVGSDIDSLNRRTMSLVVLIKTRQDGSSMVAASSASRRRMYARWPLRSLPSPPLPCRPLCFSRWRRTLVEAS